MKRRAHLGELEARVLTAVLRTAPANGKRIYQELERLAGRDPSLPAIHVTLRRCEEKGLLVSETGSPSPRGGRPRRYYRLTPGGIEALREFRESWEALWAGTELPEPGEGASGEFPTRRARSRRRGVSRGG